MQTEQIPVLKADEYPGGIWYYEPHTYQPYRYVLGRVGTHPLVCIGINPSTAQPGALDPTLKSVAENKYAADDSSAFYIK